MWEVFLNAVVRTNTHEIILFYVTFNILTEAPTCEVTVIAISAQMITCEAECSNTTSITFSSDIPGNNDLQTCGGQLTHPTINGSTGIVIAIVDQPYSIIITVFLSRL